MVPERNKGTTKGLRVINSVGLCVLKSNLFRPYVTRKQCENVVVISSSISVANLKVTLLSCYSNHATCVSCSLRCWDPQSKTRDLREIDPC